MKLFSIHEPKKNRGQVASKPPDHCLIGAELIDVRILAISIHPLLPFISNSRENFYSKGLVSV
jgi:hypothetical protein